jgi:hypothetical protein
MIKWRSHDCGLAERKKFSSKTKQRNEDEESDFHFGVYGGDLRLEHAGARKQ